MLELIIAFGAGFISFLSPCVLPLIPGYISFVSGQSLKDLTEKKDFDLDLGLNRTPQSTTRRCSYNTMSTTTVFNRSTSPLLTRGIRYRASSFLAVLPKPAKRTGSPVTSRVSLRIVAEADQPVVKIGTRGR